MCVCPACGAKLVISDAAMAQVAQAAIDKGGITWTNAAWQVSTPLGSVNLRSAFEARIFELLWRNQGAAGLTGSVITERLSADKDGGHSLGSIRTTMYRIRKIVAPIGIIITRYNNGVGYMMKRGSISKRVSLTSPAQELRPTAAAFQ